MKFSRILVLAILFILSIQLPTIGQGLLTKTISLDVRAQRLDNVLEIISNKGDFFFSYNSRILNKDSLVTISARNMTVKEVLNQLFDQTFEFRESGNFIIIRKAPIKLVLVTNKGVVEERIYLVSGYVYDEQSGSGLNEASVYEKRMLASALTDQQGYFKLKLKSSKASTAELTVSKEFYQDTTVTIEPRHSQQLMITLAPFDRAGETVLVTPEDYLVPDTIRTGQLSDSLLTVEGKDSLPVERTRLGRFLLSGKQKVQSLNWRRFFTTRPFQFSLVPGLSSHGNLSSQVVNNFSLNIFGGYTAGTNGLEIGGLFNIDKQRVRYMQVGGLFNVVGGSMTGFQVAGLTNTVLDTVKGFQVAGLHNFVRGRVSGFQVAGIYNHVNDSLRGFQVGGLANFTRKRLSGMQVAGLVNFNGQETDGLQVAGILNYTRRLKGVQIGLINVSDTSSGYSIGLINIVLKGYHKLSFSTNEVMDLNASFKTGNAKLYSILLGGIKPGSSNKIYSFGYGLGSEWPLNKKRSFSFNPELSSQYLYLGSWDYTNLLNKLSLNLHLKIGKYVSLFAGPTYSVLVSDQTNGIPGYQYPVPPVSYHPHRFSDKVTGWIAWNVGIDIF